MTVYLLAALMGVIAGLRALTAPAAASWAAVLGRLNLKSSALAFLGFHWTPWIISFFALAELVADQQPTTPSRKVPLQFGTRVVTGAVSGGAIGAPHGLIIGAAIAGVIGAIVGTLGGAEARSRLAAAFGQDRPAAMLEDLVAIGGAALIVGALL